MAAPRALRNLRQLVRRERTREKLRGGWEEVWSREAPDEPWMHRPVSAEIVAAVDDGWFAAGGRALDLGCGQGEVTHWLSERGFPTLGVDYAAAAIERARARYGEQPGLREFQVLDLVRERLPDRRFAVVVDRGCFHAIKAFDARRYVRNLASVCAPGAHFLLFIRAFRGKRRRGEAAERAAHDRGIQRRFRPAFEVVRAAETYLGRPTDVPPDPELRGLVYWMRRR